MTVTFPVLEWPAPYCSPDLRLFILQGRCSRENCKYLHPPTHLKTQLEINGRNNLIQQKTAAAMLAQQMQFMFPGTPLHPVVSVPSQRMGGCLTGRCGQCHGDWKWPPLTLSLWLQLKLMTESQWLLGISCVSLFIKMERYGRRNGARTMSSQYLPALPHLCISVISVF